MQSIHIDRATLRGLLALAAKDDIRRHLNGILASIKPGHVDFVATDGHVLGAIHDTSQSAPDPADVIIPRAILETVAKSKSPLAVTLEFEGDACTIVDGSARYAFKSEGTFPDWRRVIPLKVSGLACQFNPDLLVLFRKAATGLGASKNAMILVGHNGIEPKAGDLIINGGCLVAVSGRDDFVGVIMPMRHYAADIPSGAPMWAKGMTPK